MKKETDYAAQNVHRTGGLYAKINMSLKSADIMVASLTALLICGGAAGNAAGGDLCAFFGAVLGVAVGVLLLKITEKHRGEIEIKVEKI